ncbi:MAG: rRNA maturation RNase YbeY [Candidatus Cloacimonetes bacterium]|nr:rRNA maturation RNase YbeY [Candidatus Cloacimonadota bacterium]MBT6993651.1 rRNA maturation RNase YbeY [Candidatus Cloacimonadota bacterium]MBT7470005.1 rRNA maturation RNase YbeY [Candidatus Cloacimonadota bacterium]
MNTPKIKTQIENCSQYIIDEKIFFDVLKLIIQQEKLDEDSSVFLRLTDDDSIKILNKKYLGRDEFTDVISFSAEIPQSSFLGNIIIDVNVANRQKGMATFKDELQKLFLHALLHLLGYDHLAEKKMLEMSEKEQQYLNIIREK